ncbi:nitroreductase family protein [Namhaeicola litoreus]|uniref:Nitroreductase family protein n=1 Tax=Namhaeicola litoreus TaxID=1052145 RepID=A0ABW3Y2B8_9FLAO
MSSPNIIKLYGHEHVLYTPQNYTEREIAELSKANFELMDKRRSIRSFSDKPVDKKIIENIIKTASTAPSGAHKQPWTFCAISDPGIKTKIRIAAEAEEKESYERRMSETWLNDLKPMGTNMYKPFLEIAPWLIVVFKRVYELGKDRDTKSNYYVSESVGIACGMLITAIHQAGLVTLTHTPSPMQFLHTILERPENERPFLLLPVGYPASPCYVPNLKRKELKDVAVFY